MQRSAPWFTRAPSQCLTPRLAAIGHVHFATAVATTQKAGEEQLSLSRRSSGDGAALARRIVGDHPLIPLELRPGDIALVLVLEQHVPFGQWAAHAAPHALAALLHADLVRGSPENIRAGVDGVGQDGVHGAVERRPPDDDAPLRRTVARGGKRDAFLAQPDMHLSHALKLGELRKDIPTASRTCWSGSFSIRSRPVFT